MNRTVVTASAMETDERERRGPRRRSEAAADYVAMFSVTMYTVLLAFIVVILWQRLDDINSDVRSESQDLTQIVWSAQRLPAADRAAMRSAVTDYTAAVLDHEWPPANLAATDRAAAAVAGLRGHLATAFSLDEQTTLRDQELAVVDDLTAARADRIGKTLASTYPEILTVALVLLSAATVLTPFLLGVRAEPLSILGVGVTIAVIVAALVLVVDMQGDYGGAFAVSCVPLQTVQQQLALTS
jgi:Na+/H+ antiporter NhaC